MDLSGAPRSESIPLAADEVHVWSLADSAAQAGPARLAVLDAAERTRAAQFRFEEHRRAYVGAHWLLRTALSHYGSLPPEAWRFRIQREGRPVLTNEAPADLHFSLSHAGGGALVAIGRMPLVGIDLEGPDSLPRVREIAPRFLHPDELAVLRERPEREAQHVALTLWTLKEAYAKAIGRGLELDFRRVRFSNSGGAWRHTGAPEDDVDRGTWHCVTFSPWPSAHAAVVAATASGRRLDWRLVPAPG
jgi:4'-phosphopantetheinyl transferase